MVRFYISYQAIFSLVLSILAYCLVDSYPDATDMDFVVKPTFTSHGPVEQTEQYLTNYQNISKPANSRQYAHKAVHETNIHDVPKQLRVKWNNKQCPYMHVLFIKRN